MAKRDPRIPLPGGPGSEPEPPAPPTERPLPVSWAILIGSVGWFVVQAAWWFTPGKDRAPSLALEGQLVQAGEWWRVLGTVFEHGNPIHLALNMSAVWSIGRVLEFAVRPYRMAVTSVVGALGAATFVLIFDWDRPTVGASGVILAWAGAILPISTSYGRKVIGLWLAQVVLISFLPFVSWSGHLGGFLFGLLCGFAMRGKPDRFAWAAPVLLFVSGVLVLIAGSGRIRL